MLRLLDKQAGRLDLARLGMDDATLAHMDRLIREPHGIVLVTGPTGSGKTTTLYAALSRLDAAALNIMTVEDPIEYDLDGISQTQINTRIEMSFARALRTILRQDPDVVMIGEIRDLETAQIAVQASLTGHLVFATLHTNDAVSAVTRLVDMGVEPFLLASSLIGVGAQRLVRKLCLECRKPLDRADAAAHLRSLGLTPAGGAFTRRRAARRATASGYRGRTGIYELLTVDDELRRLIHDRASRAACCASTRRARHANRCATTACAGPPQGVISLEEVVRVTRGNRMEAFRYEALDAAGRTVSGVVQADTRAPGAHAGARAGPAAVEVGRVDARARARRLGARHPGGRAEPPDPADGDAARIRADDGAGA